MFTEYKYESKCIYENIFRDNRLPPQCQYENSNADIDYETPKEFVKQVKIILLKDSVYIMTPQDHHTVMTI